MEVTRNCRKRLQSWGTSPCATVRSWGKNNWVGTAVVAGRHAVGSLVTVKRDCGWCFDEDFAAGRQPNSCRCQSRLAVASTRCRLWPWRRPPLRTTPRYNRNLRVRQIYKKERKEWNLTKMFSSNREFIVTCKRPLLGLPTWWTPPVVSNHSTRSQSLRQLSEWGDPGYLHLFWCIENPGLFEVFQETSGPGM